MKARARKSYVAAKRDRRRPDAKVTFFTRRPRRCDGPVRARAVPSSTPGAAASTRRTASSSGAASARWRHAAAARRAARARASRFWPASGTPRASITSTPSVVMRDPASARSRVAHVVIERRRAAGVEPQLHGGRHLVDVLPARPRCANERLLELGVVDDDGGVIWSISAGSESAARGPRLASRAPDHYVGSGSSLAGLRDATREPRAANREPRSYASHLNASAGSTRAARRAGR